MGVVAALKWLFGTDVTMSNPQTENEAMREVGQSLKTSPVDVAIARAERATDQLHRALPARSFDQALQQMFPERQK